MDPRVRQIAAVAVLAVAVGGEVPQTAASDLLGMFSPARREAIEAGRAVVELASVDDVDVALIGAVRSTIDDERLVAWYREVEQLQRGKYIPVIGRFSPSPRIDDLAGLALDDDDVEALRNCRPGDCDIKLSAGEMHRISWAIEAAGRNWRPAAQAAFRQVLLERARKHLARGFAGAPPYEDQKTAAIPAIEFAYLLNGLRVPGLCMTRVIAHLRDYPRTSPNVETFLFWSKDTLGDLKPIIGITQVSIVRGCDSTEPTLIASSQVYASHYLTASLSVTAVSRAPGGERYLVYARQSRADLFTGAFGSWVRRIVRKRVGEEGPGVLDGLRRRVEAGPPERQRGIITPT